MSKKFIEKFVAILPGFMKTDVIRKLIALFFAVLVWYSVAHKLGKEKQINGVKVKVSLPENYISTGSEPTVTLRVSAREGILSSLYASDFTVKKELDEVPNFINDKTVFLNLHINEVKAPAGVTVIDIQPKKVPFNLDRMVSKSVAIKVRFNGSLPTGYMTGNTKLAPENVTLTGPENMMANIQFVSTKPILLDNTIYENFEYDAEIEALPRDIIASPKSVKAYIEIEKEMKEKVFRTIPIRILEYPGDRLLKVMLLSKPHVKVRVSGSKKKVDALKVERIKAFIDLSPFTQPGTYNVQVDCWIAGDNSMKIREIEPKQVSVSIEKARPEEK